MVRTLVAQSPPGTAGICVGANHPRPTGSSTASRRPTRTPRLLPRTTFHLALWSAVANAVRHRFGSARSAGAHSVPTTARPSPPPTPPRTLRRSSSLRRPLCMTLRPPLSVPRTDSAAHRQPPASHRQSSKTPQKPRSLWQGSGQSCNHFRKSDSPKNHFGLWSAGLSFG